MALYQPFRGLLYHIFCALEVPPEKFTGTFLRKGERLPSIVFSRGYVMLNFGDAYFLHAGRQNTWNFELFFPYFGLFKCQIPGFQDAPTVVQNSGTPN